MKNSEEQVLHLLRNIKSNVALLNKDVSLLNLQDILSIVERGEFILLKTRSVGNNLERDTEKEVKIDYNIDLYQAENLVRQYRQNSEGGCQSCEHIKSYMPCQDEHVTYCSLYEKHDLVDSGSSPRITQFSKIGCGDKKSILKRKLEEVLKDHIGE